MTKDVELHSGSWKKMNSALTGVTGNSSVSSSGYGSYTNAQAGSYRVGTSSTGFAKRIEELVEISERAKQLINEKDTDGVVSFRYHDERSNAQTLQSKLGALEKYSANVSKYLKEKIDQPFYEAMDKVGAKLEALSIQNYKTTNTVGYKRTDVIRDEYGNKVGTMEVTPKEIGIDELYKVESPYKAALQKSYEEFKNSEAYKEHKLTQDEYLMAMHHTRAFEYESIDDQKSKTELWRDLALGAGVIVLTIFCPPAGAVAGTALAAADMYSAASGKDWGTGRELDGTERGLRAAFSLFDLIPAGKYLSGLVKTGKTAGIVGVKTSLKTALKEGLEQGAKNLDNFKGVLKNIKSFGDNILSKVKTYGQQLDNFRPSKVLSRSAESLSNGLRYADNVLSEAAQNFRLNMGLEPQLVGGTMPSGGGKLSHLADNLSAFSKNLDGSVDEVVQAGSKAGKGTLDNIIKDGSHFDEVGKLKPNVRYQTGEFEYLYQTDDLGRLTNWNAPELQLTERNGRLPHDSNTPGKLPGDHAGHLAGDRFGGSPEIDNLVSQLSDVNLSDYKKLENQWAKALEEGKDVSVNVKVNYVGDSLRPDSFEVSYSIDGDYAKQIIKNVR
ncbi:DNA/RNA non-specific endonuclease [Streptococcus anginosus]|uniref:DNA/RNA non-specific endonuclease n=1 Tax=Streptococcus anginosus TaxID=1328 RepID=UPI0022E59473|nr:DNA/RNA non-specific endonuclease [Streptococcus anginosus]